VTIWVWSDPHFGHHNLVRVFTRADGSPARDFPSVADHDEVIIANFNARVQPDDHVYCLGDVGMRFDVVRRVMPRLHGKHRLLLGNHDKEHVRKYMEFFQKIGATRRFDRSLILSHFPIAPWSLGSVLANVHGHVHASLPYYYRQTDPISGAVRQYFNVSLEMTGYAPVSLDDLITQAKEGHAR
jgi:calcineurin-like phosphoesterase family protein